MRIGDDVEVTVMAVNGSQVRIGIKAPRNVSVDREEIAERKQREERRTFSRLTFRRFRRSLSRVHRQDSCRSRSRCHFPLGAIKGYL